MMDSKIKAAMLGDAKVARELTEAGILLPCPVCGGPGGIAGYPGDNEYSPACIKCGVMIDEWFASKTEAINAWNRRANLQEPNEALTLEELRGMDGEPVYLIYNTDGNGMWRVYHGMDYNASGASGPDTYVRFEDNSSLELSQMGSTWLAYRRPPEEGEG